jgi:hypothetical protein
MTSIKSQLVQLAATTTSQVEDVTTTTVSQQWIPAVHSFSTWTKQQLDTAIDQLKSINIAVKDATEPGQSEKVSTLNEISEMVGKGTGDLTALSQQALEEVGKTAIEIRGEIGPQLESTLDMLKEQMDVATAQIQQLGDQIKTAISSSHSSSNSSSGGGGVCGDKTAMQQQKNKKVVIIDNNDKKTKKKKMVIATAPTTTTPGPGPRNERYAAFWNKMIGLRDTALDAVESATVSVEDMSIKIKQTISGTGTDSSSKGVATKRTATIETPTPTITEKKSTISTNANDSSNSSSGSSSTIMKNNNNIFRQRIRSIAEPTKSSIDSVLTKIPPKAKSVATPPITAGILTVAAIVAISRRWLMKKGAETADERALEAEAAKRSAYLAKQRARFRAALAIGDDDEVEEDKFKGSVDRSIYSAVSRIPSSSTNSTSTSSSGSDDDDEEEEEEEAPPVYDKETLKAWAAFVKGSKMEQGQMWVPEDVDQGMPEIYIDLNRDRNDDDDK